MTNGSTSKQKRHFTLAWLPWLLGMLVLALYALTANPALPTVYDWTGFLQQPPLALSYSGDSYSPQFLAPVLYVVTWPIRLLPAQVIPVAMNFFAVVCGALALGQLARSVALLPHDRTRDQRERESSRQAFLRIPLAWLPPVLATVVCALSLSVWEHGTNGTAEMFDLLMFAYVVRSLLEFRLDENPNRLYRAAFVFGAAMTNNLAMIAFFPLFIVALVWTRKLAFFNLKFLARMAGCGLLGLMFYLVLPTIGSFSDGHSMSFWQLLTNNVMAQKWILFIFPRNTILLLSLTSVLPVFLFSIKWSSQFGDPSRVGVIITTLMFHLSHIVVLLACLWMTLDPDFSPRQVGYGLAFLPLYFLAALSIGYYSGYLLLISQPTPDRFRAPSTGARALQWGVATAIILLLIAVPAALIHRNLPQIRVTNGAAQTQFAKHLTENLPPNGIIISDDPYRLSLTRFWLARQGRAKDYTLLCSQWLPQPDYQRYLSKIYPKWPTPEMTKDQEKIPNTTLVALMEKLGREQPITYLHPSFGYYFETFAGQPDGLIVKLSPHGTNHLISPPQTPEVIARNQKSWSTISNEISATIEPHIFHSDDTTRFPFPENLYRRIGLKPIKSRLANDLGAYYSRSLVNWAVELQRAGDYEGAVGHYQLAQRLNPKNVVADINLAFNEKFRSGQPLDLALDRPLEDFFGESRSWDQVLNLNGPYDAPALSFAQGYVFAQGNLIRQAAQAFERARQQATNDVTSRLWLGQLNLNQNFPDRTIELVAEIRQIAERVPGLSTNLNDLFTLEAAAYLTKNQDAIAQRIIETNLASRPDDFNILASACKAYADNGRHANALAINERMLKLAPENVACWINQGCFQIELSDPLSAIKSFTQAVNLETNNYRAVLYRGIARLRAEQLEEARKDYETVQRQYPNEPTVDFGLGEIAYRQKDTNTAIRYYEAYLTNAPAQTIEAKSVIARLDELKGVQPKAPTATATPPK
jgi:tetratricopeptide (TPR) repeat protein